MTIELDLQSILMATLTAFGVGGAGYYWWKKRKEMSRDRDACETCGVKDDIKRLEGKLDTGLQRLEDKHEQGMIELRDMILNHLNLHLTASQR